MNQIFSHPLTDTAIQRRAQVFTILEEICQELEWTQTQFEKARNSYEAVADWLAGSSDPMLASLHVYLHGSGALGTSIKPIGRDEFDVDLISFILGLGPKIAPARLKAAIGKRLREHAYYASILEEKKRCWRLNYAGDFHLDISPTIANPNCMNGGELVPDRKLRDWHATNPRAYRTLFDERAALVPQMTQSIIAAQRDAATTEPFPVRQSVKGTLRRTVQLLKRHRDLEFLHVQEEIAPISIIITTLAMRSYEMCVMLLADPAHGNVPTCTVGEGQAEDTFGLEQALGMMAHSSVREEREVLFRGIEPIVHSLIVRRHPTEFPGRAFGMMKRMGHLKDPLHSCASIRHSGPRDRG